ncbi:hypothetical protein C1G86_0909 [Dehalococcoides mccartyi]|uniref:Uncharacterized protein n=1 Tax=Dehalococcoides mccartyi TaxID=61435 RepID=A0A142VA67_9CHLR|nr:hypothetical protein Dm11a5_0904 [Dehalococcoides mccartyi]MBA2085298.1 hypothetical protein [Dehalococcoides mccartyi]RAL69776.1 hypothetical protein C1G87_0883 [Dehalococcoides mccartyi]RAL70538.1 hypothetical protein C1G86_0909 [Dehalococcoides mccartyi]
MSNNQSEIIRKQSPKVKQNQLFSYLFCKQGISDGYLPELDENIR